MATHVNGASRGAAGPFSDVCGPGMEEKDSFVPRPLILGAGEPVSVNDMVAAARAVTGREIPVRHVAPEQGEPKQGEMPAVIVDISAAREIGFVPTHDLRSGLGTVWPEFSEAAK
jgi:nucleoside-diphosphate-sugar epimerase